MGSDGQNWHARHAQHDSTGKAHERNTIHYPFNATITISFNTYQPMRNMDLASENDSALDYNTTAYMNDTASNELDDGGFDDYIEQTTDTGNIPLIVVVVFGIVTQLILLPVLVVSRRRYLRTHEGPKQDESERDAEQNDTGSTRDEQHNQEEEDGKSRRSMAHAHDSDEEMMDIAVEDGSMDAATESEKTANANAHWLDLPAIFTAAAGNLAKRMSWPSDEDSRSRHQPMAHVHGSKEKMDVIVENGTTNANVEEVDLPAIFDADHTRHHRKMPIVQGVEEEGRISTLRRQQQQLTDLPVEQDESVNRPIDEERKERNMASGISSYCRVISKECSILLRFDNEARRVFRLAIPFTISELVETVSEIVVLGIISHQLGTDALSAFAVFETLLEITTEFSGGVVDAITTLASQAYGAGNNKLVGQYVQLCSITYFLFQIPFILMWSFATFDIMLFMGFNENIAQMAKVYARWAVWRETVLGVTEVYYSMLEVVEKEIEVAVIGNIEALFELGAIAISLYLFKGDLVTVAVIGIVNGVCFFIFTLAFTFWRGWLRPFAKGIFASLAFKNRIAVKQVVKTASPLAFGSVLIHGEWEVLTVFAAYLGPAEVTAWAVLGNLWDIFESSNE